ncbi:MAG: hypothetical protein Q9211_006277 [Gyalolechia sp. 1 TL-2023]
MALPMLKSAVACADFSKTVQPYISQLNDLPQQVFQSATSPQALKDLYLNTNPLVSAFAFSLFLAPIFLVISEINRNYSQVDRAWRPQVLLFTVTTPTYLLLLTSPIVTPDMTDMIFSQFMLVSVFLAFTADQQQWGILTVPALIPTNFQNAKKSYQSTAKVPPGSRFSARDLDRGFLTKGLWSLSRHPNFLAEQSVWITLYLWSCWTTHTYYNWSGVGAVAYMALFQASTWFTELITAKKYPDYKIYQQRVGKFVPSLVGGAIGELNDDAGEKKKV